MKSIKDMICIDFSSLRVRLLVLVILASIPFLLFTVNNAVEERNAAMAQIQVETLQLTQLSAFNQEEWIEGSRQLLTSLAYLPVVRDRDSAACSQLFADMHKHYPQYANIYAVAPNGDLFCSAVPIKQAPNAADLVWFKRAVTSHNFSIGDYQAAGRVSRKPIIVAAYPIYENDTQGNLQAVVAASLDLAWLNKLAEKMQLPQNASFSVIDQKGTILARYPDPQMWVGQSLPETGIIKTILSLHQGTAEALGVDGVKRFYTFAPVHTGAAETGIFVSVGIPVYIAFVEVNRILIRNLTGLSIVILLMLVISWFGSDAFVLRNMNKLVIATGRLGYGDLGARTGVSYENGEVGKLARAFDEMAGSLQNKDAERKKAQDSSCERLTRIAAIGEIDKAVMEYMPIPHLLTTILEKVPEQFGAEAVAISLLDEETPRTKSFVMILPDGSVVTEEAFQLAEDMLMWFVQQKEPVLVYDLEFEPRIEVLHDRMKGMKLVTYLGVPLLVHGKTIGIMHMLTSTPHEFAKEDIDFFKTLADHAAIAVDNSRMYSDARKRAQASEKMISGSLDIAMGRYKSIEHAICKQLSGTFGEDKLAYYPYDEATKEKGIVGIVASTKKPIYLPDCCSDDRWVNVDPAIRSAYFVPMMFGEQMFGVVGVLHGQTHAFTPDDRQLMESLTNYAAMAQESAKMLGLMRQSEEKYRNLMQNAGDAILIMDEDGNPYDLNKKTFELFGYTRDEILAMNLTSLFPETEHPRVFEAFTQINDTGSGSLNNVLMCRKDGTSIPVDITVSTVIFGGRRFTQAICRDITEQKQSEETLRESEERNRLLIDFSPYGITIHREGKIIMVNPQAVKILGAKSARELLGKPVLDIIHPDYHDMARERIRLEEDGKIAPLIEEKFLRMDGSPVDVEIVAIPVTFRGKIYKYGVFSDITERKNAVELRIEKEALEYASKAKSEFLASMSHELRTPLNAVLGFSQLLRDGVGGELNEKQKRFVDNINSGGTFLLNLINDILDLSKVEAGKIELNIEKISLKFTIEETITLIKEKAMKHNIKIIKELEPGLEFIEADKQRVKQILFNLLSNAVKFSKDDGGTVTITAKKIDDNLQMSVSDTGIGIKPENIGKMFQKFEQLEKGISAKYGGTGLGLAITKQLVEMHGGKIWAQSKYGEGSTFIFTLPLEAKKVKQNETFI